MPDAQKEYQSLPGRGMRRQGLAGVGRSRLWLGKDHLLCVDSQWYTEEYKRFYFRDIQAFIIRKTQIGKIFNIIFAVATLPFLAAAIADAGSAGVVWWCIAGFWILMLVINTLRGPTSVAHIRTAVQTDELPSLQRLRSANKVLARLRPLISAAQGDIPAAEIPARMEQLMTHGTTSFSATGLDAPPVITETVSSVPEPFTPPSAAASPTEPPGAAPTI